MSSLQSSAGGWQELPGSGKKTHCNLSASGTFERLRVTLSVNVDLFAAKRTEEFM